MGAPQNRAFVLLGSNLEKEKNLPQAARLLAERCQLLAVSTVYVTAAVGEGASGDFLNAAALLVTPLSASQLKEQVLRSIESELGRVRSGSKNAPRPIDLDIVLFNDEIFSLGRSRVPDPDLLRFAHAIVPVAELAPTMRHPETGEPLAVIARRVLAQAEEGGATPLRRQPELSKRLSRPVAESPVSNDPQ